MDALSRALTRICDEILSLREEANDFSPACSWRLRIASVPCPGCWPGSRRTWRKSPGGDEMSGGFFCPILSGRFSGSGSAKTAREQLKLTARNTRDGKRTKRNPPEKQCMSV